jgi:hypothetical protein
MKHPTSLMLAAALLLGCGGAKKPNDQSPAAGISAIVYEHGGKIVADGALVKVYDAGSDSGEPIIVTITDDRGRYFIANLPDGIYNFWAEKDSFVLFQQTVPVSSMQTLLRDDTLESPSTLTGIVGIQDFHDTRSVTIRVLGIDRPDVIADAQGRFTLTGLAGGTWPLLLRSTIAQYLPTLKTFFVSPSSNDTIRDTIQVYYGGIPVVSGITFTQDTFAGVMKLSWKNPAYNLVRDYLIYSDSCAEIRFLKEPTFITEDTFCIDSSRARLPVDQLDTAPRCLSYRIAIRNTVPSIGPFCNRVEVSFAPKSYLTTYFTHHVEYEKDSCDSASPNDTITISLTARNRTRPLRTLYWYDPARKDTIGKMTVGDSPEKQLTDTIRYAFDSIGTKRLLALVVDNAGSVGVDTIPVKIVKNRLTINTGEDTGVFSCDTIHLHAEAHTLFGRIVQWEWKIGSDSWTQTSGPDTAVAASLFGASVSCSCAVMDEDGNRARDGFLIRILVIPQPLTEKVAAGGFYDLVLDGDGVLQAQGMNESGQLGRSTISTWVPLGLVMKDVWDMDAGDCHTLILKTDGTFWACGCNDHGQLGDGSLITRKDPVKIMGDVIKCSAGAQHSLFLKADRTLWACGANSDGRLGDSTTLERTLPVLVMRDVQAMSAGDAHSMIVKADGTLWACGANQYGQLGDGTNANRSFPVQVMTGVKSVSAGGAHTLILKTDGTLWACGWNQAGQLGDNSTENRSTPVLVLTDVQSMVAGSYHSHILKTDGTLWGCGENSLGQLGDGAMKDRLAPVKVMADVKSIDAGKWHSLILLTNGTVWIYGAQESAYCGGYGVTLVSQTRVLLIP